MVDQIIWDLIHREGGYVNRPNDRGGPTNYGITQRTLSAWLKRPATILDVQTLSVEEAFRIYEQEYWIKPGFHLLSDNDYIDEMLFDACVHHGVFGAGRLLQGAVNTTIDGIVGPKTRAAVKQLSPHSLALAFMAERIEFLGDFISDNPEQAEFAGGWMERMGEFLLDIQHIPNACA